MGDPQESVSNRGPLGQATNQPVIDQGTSAKTKHSPPGVLGQSNKKSSKHAGHGPALASFDMQNAVIFVNQDLLENISKSRRSGKPLHDKDVVTMSHEFIHVMQYKEIFKQYADRKERAEHILQKHKDWVKQLTEEEYVKKVIGMETQAEKLAQRIYIELLSSFNRSRGGRGISAESNKMLSTERAKNWMQGNRGFYSTVARKRYQSLKAELRQSAPEVNRQATQSADQHKVKKATPGKTQKERLLHVSKIRTSFPVRKSATLKKLVDAMVKYNIHIVVSMTQDEIK